MQKMINLGGASRPLLFGSRANYEYEVAFGRNPADDFVAYSLRVQEAEASGKPVPSVPFVLVCNLAYSGLVCGCHKQRLPVNFTVHDVADWLGENTNLIVEVLTAFTDAQPKAKPDDAEATEGNEKGEPQA